MAIEQTPRLGLTQWTDPELLDPVHPDQFNADHQRIDAFAVEADKRLVSLSINVRDYGAVGDGVADDTAAIQEAVADLAAGSVLYFPAGSYLHNGITITGLSNFEITGPGELVAATAVVNHYLRIYACTDFRIVGLRSRHQNPTARRTTPARSITVEGCARFSVVECEAHGAETVGIMVRDSSHGVVANNIVHDTLADGIGLYGDTHHVTVTGNTIHDTGDDSIAQVGTQGDTAGPAHNTIVGNTCIRSKARGIVIAGGFDSVIVGNVIKDTSFASIYIAHEPTRNLLGCERIVATGNVCVNANTYAAPGYTMPAILVQSVASAYPVNDVIIADNLIETPASGGIQIGGSSGDLDATRRVSVRNNRIHGTGGIGISTYGVQHIDIAGNVMIDTASNGIFVDSSATGAVHVTGNTIHDGNSGNGARPLVDVRPTAAASVVVAGNTATAPAAATSTTYSYDLSSDAVAYGNVGAITPRGGQAVVNHRGSLALSAAPAHANLGGGVGVLAMRNAVTVPNANPSNGGVLYVEAGALKYRGAFGTVTTLGPA